MFKFQLGDYLDDLVTGFSGVVTVRSDYITGCNRYYLQPRVGEDGRLADGEWFDEPALQYDPKNLGRTMDLNLANEQPPG